MKNDLKNSAIEQVELLAKTLEIVRRDITKLINYEKSLETEIISLCEIYGINNDELSSVKVQDERINSEIYLQKVFDVYPNDYDLTLLSNIVATIRINEKATEENLRFSANFQEPIIKNIMNQLNKLSTETKKKVVVK